MNPLSAAAGVSSRSGSPLPQRAAAVESSVLSGGGGGAAVDSSLSLGRTHESTPVLPHGLARDSARRVDAVELESAAAVSRGGSADA